MQKGHSLLSELAGQNLTGERRDLADEIGEWARSFARKKDFKYGKSEGTEPYRKKSIILENKRKYVIAINDPFGEPPYRIPAESATGIDYGVEFPVNKNQDKLIFVQLKSENKVLPPKQYFSMGSLYGYVLYLAGINPWKQRFNTGAKYVTKRKECHREFLFLKIYENNTCIPMSSIFRMYESTSGKMKINLQPNPKDGEVREEEKSILTNFQDLDQHLSEFFLSRKKFIKKVKECDLGIKHTADLSKKKSDVLYDMALFTGRPNVLIHELS